MGGNTVPYRTAGNRRGTWRYGFDNDIPRQKQSQSTTSSLFFFFFFGILLLSFSFTDNSLLSRICCIVKSSLYSSLSIPPSYSVLLTDSAIGEKEKKAVPHQPNPTLTKTPKQNSPGCRYNPASSLIMLQVEKQWINVQQKTFTKWSVVFVYRGPPLHPLRPSLPLGRSAGEFVPESSKCRFLS